MVTRTIAWYLAASATVASWVLSAISARKKRIVVVTNGPNRSGRASASSVSGFSVQSPNPMNVAPRTPAITRAGTCPETQVPTVEASPWFRIVATRIPAITTQGRR